MGILTKKKASQNHSLKTKIVSNSRQSPRLQLLATIPTPAFISLSKPDLSPAAFPVFQIESACPVNQPSSLGPAAMCAAVLARERGGKKLLGLLH